MHTMRPRNRLRMVLLAGVLAAAPAATASACPNCKEAVASQPEQAGRVASGYSKSIMLMMATPFVLVGTGAVVVVRVARKGGIPQL